MLSITYNSLTTITLLGFVWVAAAFDWREHRIPNPLVGLFVLVGISIYLMQMNFVELAWGIGGLFVALALLLPFYIRKGMGAGDVKLMAACGLLLGPKLALYSVGASLVFGMLFGLCYVLKARFHQFDVKAPASLLVAVDPGVWKQRFPFAVSIASGVTLIVIIDTFLGFGALGL